VVQDGTFNLNSATAYLEVDSSSSTTTPNGTNTRLVTDGVKFTFVSPSAGVDGWGLY
jgi:hypothetical protein